MFLKLDVDKSKQYCSQPAMILSISEPYGENLSDEEILKIFKNNSESEVIVITGYDPIDEPDALRGFIFSARKLFERGDRPRIIIYTNYYNEELNKKFWSGLKAEFQYYGNVFLKYGRPSKKDKSMHFNPYLGIKLKGKDQHVEVYTKLQHE
jgi:hypothetical protein